MSNLNPNQPTVAHGKTFNLVSIKDLSAMLGLSPSSIRHHIRCGRITPIRSLGRRVLFDVERVREEITRGHETIPRSVTLPRFQARKREGKPLFENGITDEVGFSKKEKTK